MAKVLISIDAALLAGIDKEAAARGLSRSAYLSLLASRELGTLRGPGRTRPVRSALRQLDALFGTQPRREEATSAIRSSRDER